MTFEQAVQSGASNIGFILSKDDPFFVVDLDTYKSQVPENHELILGAVETYAERSQSGEGFHVIGMGSVGRGRNSRFHGIEIYDRDRFIITTGNHVNQSDIAADQPFADYIMELLGPIVDAEAQCYPPSRPSDENDEALVARMASAQNGSKFSALFVGNVRLGNGKDGDGHLCPGSDAHCYESQSEADLALIEMVCFFTPDDEQVARVFLASALGQREKARRRDYVLRSVRSARAMIASNALPLLDFNALMAKAGSAKASLHKPSSSQRPSIILTRVSDVAAKPVLWVWRPYLARGKLTIAAGHPGLGKSQLSIHIASMISTGGALPNTITRAPKGSVIMLSCEDDIADTIRPRLEAAGADLTKVHVLEAVYDKKGDRRLFSIKDDIARLEEAIDQIEDVVAVSVDPVTAYLDGTDTHKTSDVRAALAPLQELAMRREVAVLAVSHLNKSGGGGSAVNAITGSGAFVATARGAFLIAQDPDDPDKRLLLEIKNNLGRADGLAFRIEEKSLPSGITAPCVVFEPGTVEITADEALSRSNPSSRGESATDVAESFLLHHLRPGPVPATEMEERAQEAGIAPKTLRKAKENLCVISRKETGQNGHWVWSLPLSGTRVNMP